MSPALPFVRVENLTRVFSNSRLLGWGKQSNVRAVDGVSFDFHEGETLSIVGESGSGKTTLANLLLRIETPTSGRVTYKGRDIFQLTGPQLREYRSAVQAVFQDPWTSLNPRMRIRDIIAEPLRANGLTPRRGAVVGRVKELLVEVGLDPAGEHSYPHEFSGGQRQRIAVARALATKPKVVVLDEPVSSLDVSIAAQLTNLLSDLQERFGMAYLLIAHNLATVRQLSNRVLVLYLGQVVEIAESEELFTNPLHPYTKALLQASLPTRPEQSEEVLVLAGELVPATEPARDCRFQSRCPFAFKRCGEEVPELREVAPGHQVACHLY